jgi:thioesterase domain-containing protein
VAKHIGHDQHLYALQAQGLYDVTPPHTKIEQMATHYIGEMRTVQPEGPYYLVGYCSGAVVVFEMAHQLEQLGQEVALLASINGTSPTYGSGAVGRSGQALSSMLPTSFSSYWEALPSLSPQQKWAYRLKKLADSIRQRALYLSKVSRFHRAYWRSISMLMRYYRSRQRYRPLPARIRDKFFLYNSFWAEREYRPKPYTGRMIIFRAKGLYHDPMLGWTGLVTGGIKVHEIPGVHRDHRNIVEEPAVRTLGERMRECLLSLRSADELETAGKQASK